MNKLELAKMWCIMRHRDTNHMYDKYLPYEMHLRMVVQAFHDFKHLLPTNMFTKIEHKGGTYVTNTIGTRVVNQSHEIVDSTHEVIELACWGHDLIEDARCSFNDVSKELGGDAANIVYAVTNEKGKNRAERGNDKYYEGIRNTSGAQFVKMCDRIANVQYSKMTKSRMFDMYGDENEGFLEKIQCPYPDMTIYLNNLFND